MKVTVIRHANAQDVSSTGRDGDRSLLKKGREQAMSVAALMMRGGDLPDVVVSSPLLRCVETSKIITDRLNLPAVLTERRLSCGMQPHEAMDVLRDYQEYEHVCLVGHEPDLSGLIASMLGLTAHLVKMKKASVAHFSQVQLSTGRGLLEFLIPPSLHF